MRNIWTTMLLCWSLSGVAGVQATTIYTNDPAVLNSYVYNRDRTGIYFSTQGGMTFLNEVVHDGVGATGFNTEHDLGWNAGGSLGVDLGEIRTEFEVNYRQIDVDKIKAGGLNDSSPGGQVSTFSFLLNVFYDFENRTHFTPYIGAGVGGAVVSLDKVSDSTGTVVNVNAEDTVFAFKGIVGSSFSLTPDIDLTFDYSFFGTTAPEFNNSATGGKIESEIGSHSISGGIRFRF